MSYIWLLPIPMLVGSDISCPWQNTVQRINSTVHSFGPQFYGYAFRVKKASCSFHDGAIASFRHPFLFGWVRSAGFMVDASSRQPVSKVFSQRTLLHCLSVGFELFSSSHFLVWLWMHKREMRPQIYSSWNELQSIHWSRPWKGQSSEHWQG